MSTSEPAGGPRRPCSPRAPFLRPGTMARPQVRHRDGGPTAPRDFGAYFHDERLSKGDAPMRVRMTPTLELPALSGRSRAWTRALPILAFLALGLVSSASAALATPEEGEAQLMALLNRNREVK